MITGEEGHKTFTYDYIILLQRKQKENTLRFIWLR